MDEDEFSDYLDQESAHLGNSPNLSMKFSLNESTVDLDDVNAYVEDLMRGEIGLSDDTSNQVANEKIKSSILLERKHSPDSTDPEDFLSWLETSDTTKLSVLPPTTENANAMDDLFDEVFGDDGTNTSIISVTGLEQEIGDVIRSSFPDIGKLKTLVQSAGHIPSAMRGQIWNLLLSGGSAEDQEAEFWRRNGSELRNYNELDSDCDAIVEKYAATVIDTEQAATDMKDVLTLYCQRRGTDYNPFLCYLLTPLLLNPQPLSRSLASSCFYCLASGYIPLINLQQPCLAMAMGATHGWLRLLIAYHFPDLVIHLDRVLGAGWEQAAKSPPPAEIQRLVKAKQINTDLEQMERQLLGDTRDDPGSDAGSGPPPDAASDGSASVSVSAPGRHAKRWRRSSSEGLIPQHWICGFFSCSVPPSECCLLWDWIIATGERYAGLYLTAALLGGFKQSLLSRTGAQIESWLERVARGEGDWFKDLPVRPQSEGAPSNENHTVTNHTDWTSFTLDWIQATKALQRDTPKAFMTDLAETELWAEAVSKDRPPAPGSATETKSTASLWSGNIFDSGSGRNVTAVANRFRLLGRKLRQAGGEQDDGSVASTDESVYQSRVWPHDSMAGVTCIWSGAEQVVPFMCASKRTYSTSLNQASAHRQVSNEEGNHAENKSDNTSGEPQNPTSILTFVSLWTSRLDDHSLKSDAYLLPLEESDSAGSPDSRLNYFAIDCRSSYERRLGRFPKAFCFDPRTLTDPDALSGLMVSLSPLMDLPNTHICLIGAGDEYVRMHFKQMQGEVGGAAAIGNSALTDIDKDRALEEALSEQVTRLNAVAVFLMKRNFARISVLLGGFAACARYLHSPRSSISLSSALVDAHGPSLDMLLGETDVLGLGLSVAAVGKQKSKQGGSVDDNGGGESPADTSGNSSSGVHVTGGEKKGGGILAIVGSLTKGDADKAKEVAAEGAKEVLGDITRKLSTFREMTMATFKKTVATASNAGKAPVAGGDKSVDNNVDTADKERTTKTSKKNRKGGSARSRKGSSDSVAKASGAGDGDAPTFTIDSEEEEEEGERKEREDREGDDARDDDDQDGVDEEQHGNLNPGNKNGGEPVSEPEDPNRISISRTEEEKALALAMHHLSGLKAGDEIALTRESLPGAILFPAIKVDDEADDVIAASTHSNPMLAASNAGPISASGGSVNAFPEVKKSNRLLHRFLVVTRERFIVLDSGGGGVGSRGRVLSNHHLTELMKMTFRKQDPDTVTLYFVSYDRIPKTKQFRVNKRKEFIECLQKHMQRFK